MNRSKTPQDAPGGSNVPEPGRTLKAARIANSDVLLGITGFGLRHCQRPARGSKRQMHKPAATIQVIPA